ncbi:MAG: hypothetical protein D6748_03385 [Calditrichaeota bacterium]|nr:MAG: hypothetical protein D6748_03385 [Calditrichota bacterium]
MPMMRIHLNISLMLLWLGVLPFTGIAQVPTDNFGDLTFRIGASEAQHYFVKSAILYRDVDVEYDTTLHVSSGDSTILYYYPQLKKGNRFVLHLIIEPQQQKLSDLGSEFYDFFFVLGDSLTDTLRIEGVDSSVYFFRSGQFTTRQIFSRNCKAYFELGERKDLSGNIEGTFAVEFEYPSAEDYQQYQPVSLEGKLIVPETNLLSGQETNVSELKERKARFKRNLYIAIFTSLFIIAFVFR